MSAIDHKTSDQHPSRLPKRRLPPLTEIALPLLALLSALMLALAVPNIIGTGGWWTYAKAGVLAASAMVVSFAVNRLAIERGAPAATRGHLGAVAVSLGSMLAVGSGLFAATYSGLVFKDVAELQLQEHGTALGVHVGGETEAAAKAGRVLPAIRAIESDLAQKAQCEIEAACISGRGGGFGPVARIVGEQAGQAAAIAAEIARGDAAREALLERLNGLLVEYQSVLGDTNKDIWARRADLQAIDARIRQGLGELGEAVPVALLSAYAASLQAGIAIPGRIEAETRLNAILSRHGQSLAAVIATIDAADAAAHGFPRRTGVSDTFAYIAHFLPVAAITAVVELVFPLVLWAYTYWALAWDVFVRERRRENAPGSFAQATRAGHIGSGDDRFGNARQVHAEQDGRDAVDRHPSPPALADHAPEHPLDDVDAAHRPNASRPLVERQTGHGRAVDRLDDVHNSPIDRGSTGAKTVHVDSARHHAGYRDVNDSPASPERPDRREAAAPDDARRDRRGRSAKRIPHRLNGKGSHPGHDDDRSGSRGDGGHSSKPSSTRRP
ncbi:MAG: hypothetical protein M9905_19450 [Rhizobiaceae bacterium]|nr:hypothetical protein [Rhizobiaceae bacterium]